MKKLLFVVCGLLVVATGGYAQAKTMPGYWDLTNGLLNGFWQEFYNGGGPGQQNNFFRALSSDYNPAAKFTQWGLDGTIIDTASYGGAGSDSNGNYDRWDTNYAIYLGLGDAPSLWDDGTGGLKPPSIPMLATNITLRYEDGSLGFTFEGSGVNDGLAYWLKAEWHGTPYPYAADGSHLHGGHGSLVAGDIELPLDCIEFDSLELKIEAVPEPATMLLLGTGLVGFAGFRRKFRK